MLLLFWRLFCALILLYHFPQVPLHQELLIDKVVTCLEQQIAQLCFYPAQTADVFLLLLEEKPRFVCWQLILGRELSLCPFFCLPSPLQLQGQPTHFSTALLPYMQRSHHQVKKPLLPFSSPEHGERKQGCCHVEEKQGEDVRRYSVNHNRNQLGRKLGGFFFFCKWLCSQWWLQRILFKNPVFCPDFSDQGSHLIMTNIG